MRVLLDAGVSKKQCFATKCLNEHPILCRDGDVCHGAEHHSLESSLADAHQIGNRTSHVPLSAQALVRPITHPSSLTDLTRLQCSVLALAESSMMPSTLWQPSGRLWLQAFCQAESWAALGLAKTKPRSLPFSLSPQVAHSLFNNQTLQTSSACAGFMWNI